MAKFFEDFPKVVYDMNKDGSGFLSIDILRRFAPVAEAMKRAAIYFTYPIHDGERPDIVAHKIYGNSEYDWIILMFNEIHDPYFQWYMGYHDFNAFIEKKYGSVQNANLQIHHYEWIVQQKSVTANNDVIQEKTLVVDETTYHDLIDPDRRVVTCLDYETSLNDSHRNIKIIDGQYIPQILREKQRLLING